MTGNEMREAGNQPVQGKAASRVRRAAWGFAGFIILLPLVAMQFTREVQWTAGDFLFAFLLITSVGLALELTVRLSRSNAYRGGVAIFLGGLFLTVWANGAVGIIGSENADVNIIFYFVLLIALFGALAARFRPRGMAAAMVVTAIAQIGAILVAPFAGLSSDAPIWSAEVFILTGFFVGIWLTAAILFDKSARQL